MESPKRKMQKKNDYQRHKLFRKIKRRRKAQAEADQEVAEKQLKKKLKLPKFDAGEDVQYITPGGAPLDLHIEDGMLVDTAGNNYTQSALPESMVPEIIGDKSKANQWATAGRHNTSSYWDSNGVAKGLGHLFNIFSENGVTGPIDAIDAALYNEGHGVINAGDFNNLVADASTIVSPSKLVGVINTPIQTGKFVYPWSQDNIGMFSNHGETGKAGDLIFDLYTGTKLGKYIGENFFKATPKIYDYIDRAGVSKDRFLDQSGLQNTLTRYIGTGDSGYKDALLSGIIRGNMDPPLFSAKQLGKFIKKYGEVIPKETLRNLASNNISESDFNLLRDIFKKDKNSPIDNRTGISLRKKTDPLFDANTYQQYLDIKQKMRQEFKQKMQFQGFNKYGNTEDNAVQKAWSGNNMATFAYPDEVLSNDILFPGDYAVTIQNADKYAADGTAFGHFKQHPVTKAPVNVNNKDVAFYKSQKGILSGRRMMRKLSREQVARDAAKYRNSTKDYMEWWFNSGKDIRIRKSKRTR